MGQLGCDESLDVGTELLVLVYSAIRSIARGVEGRTRNHQTEVRECSFGSTGTSVPDPEKHNNRSMMSR